MSTRFKGIDLTNGIRVLLDGNTIVLQGEDQSKVVDRRTLMAELRKKIGRDVEINFDFHVTPGGKVYLSDQLQDARHWAAIDREEAEREREREPGR